MSRLFSKLTGVVLALALGGCATSYGPHGMTGGYKERQLDDNTYIVSFFGNGHTGGQQVWNYWIYRCAELTLEKGYDYFMLLPSQEHALDGAAGEPGLQRFSMIAPVDSAAASSSPYKPAQYFHYYTYTITTYSSKAIVKMYKNPILLYPGFLLDARTIKDMLHPYVASKADKTPPERKDLFVRAGVEAAIRSNQVQQAEAEALEKKLRESF